MIGSKGTATWMKKGLFCLEYTLFIYFLPSKEVLEHNYQLQEVCLQTSLLRRLQAQTLPKEAPPIGKIHPFSEMAVTFEPLLGF